ncbi:MAG: hypothetical protein V1649_03510 [Patescibacteria group bacterium]
MFIQLLNCGTGFVLSVSQENADKIILKPEMDIIGEVISGIGKVKGESMFSDKNVEF